MKKPHESTTNDAAAGESDADGSKVVASVRLELREPTVNPGRSVAFDRTRRTVRKRERRGRMIYLELLGSHECLG